MLLKYLYKIKKATTTTTTTTTGAKSLGQLANKTFFIKSTAVATLLKAAPKTMLNFLSTASHVPQSLLCHFLCANLKTKFMPGIGPNDDTALANSWAAFGY